MESTDPPKPQPGAVYNPLPADRNTPSAQNPQSEPAAVADPAVPDAPVDPTPVPLPEPPVELSAAPQPQAPTAMMPAAEPEPEAAVPQGTVVPQTVDTPIISWQASEYLHHDKHFGWYLVFGLIVMALIAVAIVTHQWLTIGVFAVMAVALGIYANKPPRVLQYSLGDHGLTIEDKFYSYDTFRSFGVIQDLAWHMIDLEPLRRFMPRLSILFEDTNRDQIVELLEDHIERQDRQPDLIERAARYLRF